MIKKKTAVSKAKKKAATAKAKVAKKKAAVKSKTVKAAKVTKPNIKAETAKASPKKEQLISAEGYATTGHEWDGIQEFNNPLPRWWVWVFITTIIFSIGYVIYYPSLPFWGGTSGWSTSGELSKQLEAREEQRAPLNAKISQMSVRDILNDPDLLTYSVAAGKAQFALNCSQCHGAAGQGAKGYPSFLDDEWLWGGRIEDIVYTITHGIRNNEDDNARDEAIMAAFGADEILTKREIKDVVRYIKVLAENYSENDASDRGKVIFAENCASCHGENGGGNNEFGAPALNNQIWLYGGKSKEIEETIVKGRAGVMPAFATKLSPVEIKKVALYVHSLTGGEYAE